MRKAADFRRRAWNSILGYLCSGVSLIVAPILIEVNTDDGADILPGRTVGEAGIANGKKGNRHPKGVDRRGGPQSLRIWVTSIWSEADRERLVSLRQITKGTSSATGTKESRRTKADNSSAAVSYGRSGAGGAPERCLDLAMTLSIAIAPKSYSRSSLWLGQWNKPQEAPRLARSDGKATRLLQT
jgi:hypothetical protein